MATAHDAAGQIADLTRHIADLERQTSLLKALRYDLQGKPAAAHFERVKADPGYRAADYHAAMIGVRAEEYLARGCVHWDDTREDMRPEIEARAAELRGPLSQVAESVVAICAAGAGVRG